MAADRLFRAQKEHLRRKFHAKWELSDVLAGASDPKRGCWIVLPEFLWPSKVAILFSKVKVSSASRTCDTSVSYSLITGMIEPGAHLISGSLQSEDPNPGGACACPDDRRYGRHQYLIPNLKNALALSNSHILPTSFASSRSRYSMSTISESPMATLSRAMAACAHARSACPPKSDP